MNDWISRKDAINIIQSWLDSDTGYSDGERNVMGCAIEELKNLPPAKCLANDRYAEGLRDGAIIERKVTERWISVKDRLPEEGEYDHGANWERLVLVTGYLTFDPKKERFVTIMPAESVMSKCDINNIHIVAWQPLPNPPKVCDEE